MSLFHAQAKTIPSSENELVFVAAKKTIAVYRLNLSDGTCTPLGVAAEVDGPQFLALDAKRHFLYTLNAAKVDEKKTGVVSGYSIEPTTGQLTFLNQQSTVGAGPTHLDVSRDGKNILVANYSGGSVASFPAQKNGRLNPAASFIQHTGSSVNPQRQTAPHAHCINFDPANRFALCCDLGLDKVLVYRVDGKKGTLAANQPAFASLRPGAGPRHLAFGADGHFVYVINELDSTVTAFRYDAKRGALTEAQTISTLPDDFRATNYPAEIAVHPSGKFLYGSNRGHNSIAVFAIDKKTGKLQAIQHAATQGKSPRHFEIDPTGKFLFAANEGSDNVVVFRIDPTTGQLTPTGTKLNVAAPQCVKFLEVP